MLVAEQLGLGGHTLTAITLSSAMPTMVFGVIICERYHLDGALYAAAVFSTTLLSMFTLPAWFQYLPH